MILYHDFIVEEIANAVWVLVTIDAVKLELYLLRFLLVVIIHLLAYGVLKESTINIPGKISPYSLDL